MEPAAAALITSHVEASKSPLTRFTTLVCAGHAQQYLALMMQGKRNEFTFLRALTTDERTLAADYEAGTTR
jgi:hypothetical protein